MVYEIIISNHARQKMEDRGATEEEVIEAIEKGSLEPASKGRIRFRKNFHHGKKMERKKLQNKTGFTNSKKRRKKNDSYNCICLLFLGGEL